MLRAFHNAIAYDLRRYCGLAIGEFWSGRVTAREILALILALPAEGGALHRAISDERERIEAEDMEAREARYVEWRQRRAVLLAQEGVTDRA